MKTYETRPYKKDLPYSYALGAFAAFELIDAKAEIAKAVYIHSKCRDAVKLETLCLQKNIPLLYDDRVFSRICPKENVYVIGVFEKYAADLNPKEVHVVLVNPGDMGNLGTIIRTLAAMNICNLGIITPAADILHPKTVRASMGAIFRIRFEHFRTYDSYRQKYLRPNYLFMSDGETALSDCSPPADAAYTLIFGNEASGLPVEFASYGTSIRIPQSTLVDSLNLPVAVGIGSFFFASGRFIE